jgi:hypothetical protein
LVAGHFGRASVVLSGPSIALQSQDSLIQGEVQAISVTGQKEWSNGFGGYSMEGEAGKTGFQEGPVEARK